MNVTKCRLACIAAFALAAILTAMTMLSCSDNSTEPKVVEKSLKSAFLSDRDGNEEIYIMDADGSNQKNLTNNAAQDEASSWSPDGSRIAFASNRDGAFEIYSMNADGTNQTRLTYTNWAPLEAFTDFSAWTPDGSRIVFASSQTGNGEIYIMTADGATVTRLTNNTAIDAMPLCSMSPY